MTSRQWSSAKAAEEDQLTVDGLKSKDGLEIGVDVTHESHDGTPSGSTNKVVMLVKVDVLGAVAGKHLALGRNARESMLVKDDVDAFAFEEVKTADLWSRRSLAYD